MVKNLFFVSLLLFLFSVSAWSQQKGKDLVPVYSTAAGAIDGYDPVAYFTDSMAVQGKADITLEWQGATWHFSTEDHRRLFEELPERYAPHYGGYCAYGWSQGYPAKIDPQAWTIVDGKLYLNYDKKVQALWNKKQSAYIEKANTNWEKALKKE